MDPSLPSSPRGGSDSDPPAVTSAESRAPNIRRLDQLRAQETARRGDDQQLRRNIALSGVVIGAIVGLTIGYLGTAIAIVDEGVGEFGFRFYRPNLTNFLRLSPAYALSGGFVGGGLTYLLMTTRTTAVNPVRWLLIAVVYALATPLLIGFLLPTTILLAFDVWEGLRPGLWLSAFVETFLGSFLDGYIYMISTVYAGALGAALLLLVNGLSAVIWVRYPPAVDVGIASVRGAAQNVAQLLLTALPLLVFIAGPFEMFKDFAAWLTGERLV